MLKVLKKSFFILKNNLIFIQPLLFLLLIFMTAAAVVVNKNFYTVPKIILLFSMILLLAAFSSGWFYINKLGMSDYNENDLKEEIVSKAVKNFKKFFEGVGIGFFKILFSYFIIFIIYSVLLFLCAKLCLIIFGEPKIIYELPKLAKAASQAEILNILNNLSNNDKMVFSYWVLAINIAASVLNFFSMLYFAVISLENANIFKSLWISIKFFFKNILETASVIMVMFLLYVILNLLSLILGTNSLSFVILIILFTLYLNYYLLLVFCLYNEKTKDNGNNGTEFIG
ncbi:MAG: hypothetical protein LUH05_05970 [Candidatus Gastranaerophilales bacterium]|nr:hypothetical protein [Candidatus Gastranaerophilales bacterium]